MSDLGAGKKVLVSGGSGFIGRVVCARFSAAGWQVSTLTRGADEPAKNRIHWDPAAGELDAASVSGFDAVVHLAGESIVGRWTDKKKQSVMQTRREGTALLATAAATAASKPGVFISASAIGFYGSRGDEVLTEDSGNGDGFLAEVCAAWEQGTAPASDAGIRVVNLRIGLVLGKDGGIISNTSVPFKLGVGGKLGSGRQWYSWVSVDDVAGAALFAAEHDTLRGPVNVVAPNPVTNAEFTKAYGKVLGRPTFMAVPSFVLKTLAPEMADQMLLASQKISSKQLQQAGFEFADPELAPALQHILSS